MEKIKTIESVENILKLCYSFNQNAAKAIYNAYTERRLSIDETLIIFEITLKNKSSLSILRTLLLEKSKNGNRWTIQ